MDVQSNRSKKKTSRKKSSKKKATNGTTEENGFASDDDTESVTSFASSVDFHSDENVEDGVEYSEDFEPKFLDNIEGAREKSAKLRQKCLAEIKKALGKRFVGEFLQERKETLTDMIEKNMKKGTSEDRILSANICSALCIQLGGGESLSVFTTLKPVLVNILVDESSPPIVRAHAATALGISCFIGGEELEDTVDCLKVLNNVFTGKIPSDPNYHLVLANSLLAWSMLLTVATQSAIDESITTCIGAMCKLLELGDLTLRIAAGETIALVYELARNNNIKFQGPVHTIYDLLRDLANESGRHKGKREKKQQKASFRDFLKSVEDGQSPDETIKFGPEYIQITSWTWLRRYNAFKEVLGSGITPHLESNPFVREVFDLGPPPAKGVKFTKVDKYERQLLNEATSKDRTLRRNQRRDNKRAAFT